MQLDDVANFIIGSLYSISFLVIISVGLAVVFGMMGIINFAHGEFLMLGAIFTVTFTKAGIPIWVSMILSALALGLFGAIIEWTMIRHLYGRIEATMLATFGLSQILVQVTVLIWGTTTEGLSTPLGSFRIGVYSFSTYTLVLVGAAILLLALVYMVYTRTRFGLKARAVTMNSQMAASVGINSSRISTGNFAFGAALAGLGGALLAPVVAVTPTMGASYVASAFMTVVLGGTGIVTGTALSSGLLGIVQRSVSDAFTAFLGSAAVLIVAIILIRVMPTGISGRLRRDL